MAQLGSHEGLSVGSLLVACYPVSLNPGALPPPKSGHLPVAQIRVTEGPGVRAAQGQISRCHTHSGSGATQCAVGSGCPEPGGTAPADGQVEGSSSPPPPSSPLTWATEPLLSCPAQSPYPPEKCSLEGAPPSANLVTLLFHLRPRRKAIASSWINFSGSSGHTHTQGGPQSGPVTPPHMQIIYLAANSQSSRAHPAGLQPVNRRGRHHAPPAAEQPFAGEAGAFLSARRLGEGPPPAGRGLQGGLAGQCLPVIGPWYNPRHVLFERWYGPGSLHLGLELALLPDSEVLHSPRAMRQLGQAGPLGK